MSQSPIDSYDKLFLKCDGTTTTFTDSSTANTKTVTANGNATQLNYKFNKSAGFFNGTTDYVVVPNHSDFNFGTGNFTIEFWVCFNNANGRQQIVSYNGDDDFSVGLDVSEQISFYIGGFAEVEAAWSPAINTWYHVACVRNGTDVYAFIDGTQAGSTASSSFDITDTGNLTIGKNSTGTAHYFNGWIKELRISNSARYTSNFTPSTTPFVSDSNTKLLMHFNTPATSPLNSAICFDGTGDYLTVPDSGDWAMTDFTLECFFNPIALGAENDLIEIGAYTTGAWLTFYGNSTSYTFDGFVRNTRVNQTLDTPPVGKWVHIALVRSGTKAYCFWDGRLLNVGGTEVGDTALTNNTVRIIDGLNGFIKEVRISKSARYTSSFTPSQTPFVSDANTLLLLHGNENNGVTTFVDSSSYTRTVTTNGNTVIKYWEDYRSCIFKDDGNTGHFPYPVGSAKVDFFTAFGAGVGYFDGTGDYLSVPDDADWDMDGNYTLEAYVRWATYSGANNLITRYSTGDSVIMSLRSDATNLIFRSNAIETYLAFSPILNTWYHVAGSKASDSTKLWLNGQQIGTTGTDSNPISDSTVIAIGAGKYSSGAEHYFNGLLDNVRISKGIARYTSTFNPPFPSPRGGTYGFFV